MPVSTPPVLPFPGFKWKWASLQPTESLNRPDYFVGVLRALANNEGRTKSDPRFYQDLKRIEAEIDLDDGPVLARDYSRNIIRNAGQYWKVLGVLGPEREIQLTPLGRLYASRAIGPSEFAIHTVLNLTLPSSVYPDSDRAAWRAAGISFRPLLLILEIVAALEWLESDQAYISEVELAYIVQPLSATTTNGTQIARSILDYRRGVLDISEWPSTITKSNDRRVSDEFLLFLSTHGLLTELGSAGSDKTYGLGAALPDDIADLMFIDPNALTGTAGIEDEAADVSNRVDRRRVSREILDRPGQRKFRRNVLEVSRSRCFLTGTSVPRVLEAAHIRPVSSEGSDLVSNGLCLRSDIHVLFDSNRIRIRPDGMMSYSHDITRDEVYGALPERVDLPQYVNAAEVSWRWQFV